MAVFVRNFQHITVNLKHIEKDIRMMKRILGFDCHSVGVGCYNNAYMQQLNKQYRQQDRPTDVLSFADDCVSYSTN